MTAATELVTSFAEDWVPPNDKWIHNGRAVFPRCEGKDPHVDGFEKRCSIVATWEIGLLNEDNEETYYACDAHIAWFLHFDQVNIVRSFVDEMKHGEPWTKQVSGPIVVPEEKRLNAIAIKSVFRFDIPDVVPAEWINGIPRDVFFG